MKFITSLLEYKILDYLGSKHGDKTEDENYNLIYYKMEEVYDYQ
jgi:hypothetical protein